MGSGEPIRVGITVGPAGHGGIATYCGELIAAMGRRSDVELVLIGALDEVVSARAALSAASHESADVDDVVVRGPRTIAQLRIALISRPLRRRRIDVVHVTRVVAPLRWPGRLVMTFHDDYPLTRRGDYDALKRRLLPPIFRRSMRRAAAVVTLNAEMAERARRYTAPGVPVIEAGAAVATRLADASEQRPPGSATSEPFAIIVGDASPRKGVEAVVRRWGEVAATRGLRLVLIGARAASDPLLTAVEAEPMATVVRDVSDAELAWWYGHAEVVIDPSAEEGFGFPRAEAAHFSVPYLAIRSLPSGADWVDVLVAADPSDRSTATRPDATATGATDAMDVMSWDEVARRTVEAYRLALAPAS